MLKNLFLTTILIQIGLAVGNICHDSICIPQNYSKWIKPSSLVEVFMKFPTVQVLEIDDSKSIIELQLYMQYDWLESRIVGPSKFPSKYIPIDKKFKDLLWCPDFFIYDQQKTESQHFIGGERRETLWLRNDNFVALDFDFKSFISCKMRFESYPFDYHDCHLRIGSWSLSDANLQIKME